MELSIKLRVVIIKDKATGEEIAVKGYRSLQEIADFVEEEEIAYLKHDLGTIAEETPVEELTD